MIYTNRAELLRAAADSIEMQEKHGIEPAFKFNHGREFGRVFCFNSLISDYEFPLAVVEGKPVFVGDELYGNESCAIQNQRKVIAKYFRNGCVVMENGGWYATKAISWNPPKPKTVTVELLREDASHLAGVPYTPSCNDSRIAEACRKALEESK